MDLQRTLSIYVDVEEKWLTCDGEQPSEDSWEEIRERVERVIEKEFRTTGTIRKDRPKFNIDWENEPEEKRS